MKESIEQSLHNISVIANNIDLQLIFGCAAEYMLETLVYFRSIVFDLWL